MRRFQLDENLNDKRLAKSCNDEKRCRVMRFPKRLKGKKDDVILPDLLTKGAPLLTRDFPILAENIDHVPELHSGIIVVRSNDPSRPFTTRSAIKNLARFKNKFPAWAETDWKQIYVEIDEDEIFLSKIREVGATFNVTLKSKDFSSQVTAALEKLSQPKLA